MKAFDRFVLKRKKDLRMIAWRTRGDSTYDDVVNEAWLMGKTLADRQCLPLDFLDPAFQKMLLSHLYQHLVRYTELTVRHAVRLDRSTGGDGEQDTHHSLLDMLASDEGNDPLSRLMATEDTPPHPSPANEHHSLASAYLILLNHFGNQMRGVATHLLISTSYAYRCCARARSLTAGQHAIELCPPASVETLKPWRHRRMLRTTRQMEFDFDEKLPFVTRGC